MIVVMNDKEAEEYLRRHPLMHAQSMSRLWRAVGLTPEQLDWARRLAVKLKALDAGERPGLADVLDFVQRARPDRVKVTGGGMVLEMSMVTRGRRMQSAWVKEPGSQKIHGWVDESGVYCTVKFSTAIQVAELLENSKWDSIEVIPVPRLR